MEIILDLHSIPHLGPTEQRGQSDCDSNSDSDSCNDEYTNYQSDEDYHPGLEDTWEEDETETVHDDVATPEGSASERKYIVTETKLLELFKHCSICLAPTKVELFNKGTFLKATLTCASGHVTSWESQPTINRKPVCNILLSAAIVFSGASPSRVLRFLSFIGVAVIKKTQFFKIQQCFLFPAILEVWKTERNHLLESLKGKPLCLAGDQRADSPGHSAKYGTYTFLETNLNRIVHFELVQVRLQSFVSHHHLKMSIHCCS